MYTLNNVICQICLNKAGKKEQQIVWLLTTTKQKNHSSQLLGCTVFSVDTIFLTLVALSREKVPLVCSTGRFKKKQILSL